MAEYKVDIVFSDILKRDVIATNFIIIWVE